MLIKREAAVESLNTPPIFKASCWNKSQSLQVLDAMKEAVGKDRAVVIQDCLEIPGSVVSGFSL